jgi:hypothetical protein
MYSDMAVDIGHIDDADMDVTQLQRWIVQLEGEIRAYQIQRILLPINDNELAILDRSLTLTQVQFLLAHRQGKYNGQEHLL